MNADLKNFVDLVAEMRRLQKSYFATRSTSVLADSKARERDVDREIERLRLSGGPKQGGLFDG